MKSKELKAELVRQGYTYQQVAEMIGISIASFQRRMNNEAEFKASEIRMLAKVLKLDDETVSFIFF